MHDILRRMSGLILLMLMSLVMVACNGDKSSEGSPTGSPGGGSDGSSNGSSNGSPGNNADPDPAPVRNIKPTAGFSYAIKDMQVQFTDLSSDSDGNVTAWDWDFGDGATDQTQNPTHTYGLPGNYEVTLTASDNDGATDVQRITLLVQPLISYPQPLGLWLFENSNDLSAATLGRALEVQGDGFTSVVGLGDNDAAVSIASGSYYRMAHGIDADMSAGDKVNEYTLLMDVFYDENSAGEWISLFQADETNGNDGEIFIHPDGDIGRNGGFGGYSSNITSANNWYRMVISIKNGETRAVYVNGELWKQGSAGSLDDDYALTTQLLIAADNDGEDAALKISTLAIWSEALTAENIVQLSNAGDFVALPTPDVNVAPVITQAPEFNYQIEQDSGAGRFVLSAVDANGDDLNWRIRTAAVNGSASMISSNNTQATLEYTPAAGFVGSDSLTVEVSDGEFTHTVAVKVSVSAPAQNEAPIITQAPEYKLTINGNSGARTFVINATDANDDDLNWKISSAPTLGSAEISASDNTSATLVYTPSVGVFGNDALTLEVDDGEFSHSVLISVEIGSTPVSYSAPVGLWQFSYASDLGLASIGDDLTLVGDNFSVATGVDDNDKAARVVVGEHFVMKHGIDAANSPGDNVNAYSLLFDINYEDADEWQALMQTDPSNASDGEIFINTSQKIGGNGAVGGYSSSQVASDQWHRIIITVNSNGERKIYVNGVAFYTTDSGDTDDRMSLVDQLLIIADESSEDNPLRLSNLAIWEEVLSQQAITDLGAAGAFIANAPEPTPNSVPVIRQGDTVPLVVGMNQTQTLTLDVSDADGNDIAWQINNAPVNGSATLTSSSNTQGVLSYTPKNLYVGNDTFVVRVSDGKAFADIRVNVTVNPNSAPVILQGDAFALNATMNQGNHDFTLDAADTEGDALTWTIDAAASQGVASVMSTGSGNATLRYVPNADFAGIDVFVVKVSDGVFSDDIRVTVSVIDPDADPVLTVIAPYGTSTPAAGQHAYSAGTEVTVSVAGEGNAKVRHTPLGWTRVGDNTASGTGTSVTFELNRASTLTWNFATEYYIDTQAQAGGSVDVTDGWYNADKPLEIKAVAQQGYYFSGWSGDTDGAVMGGNKIVLPLDRSYGTITANFSSEEVFTVVAIPDTQNYASGDIAYFDSQTQWVVDNKETENIKFVTHLGDIVNNQNNKSQWLKSNAAMDLLNNQVPYGTSPGNHDLHQFYLDYYGADASRWIDPDTNEVYEWYRGTSPTGWSDYQIVQANGRDWLFLHMDIDARDQDIAWAQSILDQHPKTLTVLTTHNYLAETGGGGASGSHTGKRGRVPVLWVGGADRNNPNQLFEKLIKPNNQIFMVLCGHNFAIYNLEETNDAGNVVHEVLVDYQTLPNGGNGFFRDMEFRWSEGKVVHRTYSESLGRDWDASINADSQGMADLHDRDNGSHFEMLVDFAGRFDETLTVQSPFGGVYPAVGTHKIGKGEPFVVSAQDIESVGSRRHVTGWRLETRDNIQSGRGNQATLTMDGNATLSWEYATQYLLTTQSIGDGIVTIPTSWQGEGAPIKIQAQPDFNATFVRWSGDLSGATVDGDTISFTMDKARGPITAVFSGSDTYSVTVNSDYSSVLPAPATIDYAQGDQVSFSAANTVSDDGLTQYVPKGYTYTIDNGAAVNGTGNAVTLAVTGDIDFTWNWTTQYQLDVRANGPGVINQSAGWVDAGSSLVIDATANDNASFSQWQGSLNGATAAGNQLTIASLNAPFGPVVANFAIDQYTLTVVSANGSPVPAVGAHTYDYGSEVELSAGIDDQGKLRYVPLGWVASGVQNSSGTGSSTKVTITGDMTFAWNWQAQALLEVAPAAQGQIKPMNAAGWHPLNSVVDISIESATGFSFSQWQGELPTNVDASQSDIRVLMDQPRAINADFTPALATQGTPHWWMNVQQLVSDGDYDAAESSDVDGNGLTVQQEYQAGIKAGKSFRFDSIEYRSDSQQVALAWPANPGREYTVRRKDSVNGSFTDVLTGQRTQGLGVNHQVVLDDAANEGFYGVSVELLPATPSESLPIAQLPGVVQLNFAREMVLIPAGSFSMGEDDAGIAHVAPEHSVELHAFYMDKYEVTRGDWRTVATWANANGYDLPITLKEYDHVPDDDHPAVPITWYDAIKWANARSEMEGLVPAYYLDTEGKTVYRSGIVDLGNAHVNWSGNGYRLPTEAEWEYAARGKLVGQEYPWGNASMISRGNSWQNLVSLGEEHTPYPITRPVGHFDGRHKVASGNTATDMANGYGLYDMAGNAHEWVWNWDASYNAAQDFHPQGPDNKPSHGNRMLRGGSWWNNNVDSRVFHRYAFPPAGDDPYGINGFRTIRSAHSAEQATGVQ